MKTGCMLSAMGSPHVGTLCSRSFWTLWVLLWCLTSSPAVFTGSLVRSPRRRVMTQASWGRGREMELLFSRCFTSGLVTRHCGLRTLPVSDTADLGTLNREAPTLHSPARKPASPAQSPLSETCHFNWMALLSLESPLGFFFFPLVSTFSNS